MTMSPAAPLLPPGTNAPTDNPLSRPVVNAVAETAAVVGESLKVIGPISPLALFNVTLTSPASMDETYVALALIPIPVTCMPVKMPDVLTYTMLWPELPVPATTTPVAVVTVMVAVEVYPEPALVIVMLEKLRLANTGVPVAVTPPAMLGALNDTVAPAE